MLTVIIVLILYIVLSYSIALYTLYISRKNKVAYQSIKERIKHLWQILFEYRRYIIPFLIIAPFLALFISHAQTRHLQTLLKINNGKKTNPAQQKEVDDICEWIKKEFSFRLGDFIIIKTTINECQNLYIFLNIDKIEFLDWLELDPLQEKLFNKPVSFGKINIVNKSDGVEFQWQNSNYGKT